MSLYLLMRDSSKLIYLIAGTFGVVCKATLVNDCSTDDQSVAVKMARSELIP